MDDAYDDDATLRLLLLDGYRMSCDSADADDCDDGCDGSTDDGTDDDSSFGTSADSCADSCADIEGVGEEEEEEEGEDGEEAAPKEEEEDDAPDIATATAMHAWMRAEIQRHVHMEMESRVQLEVSRQLRALYDREQAFAQARKRLEAARAALATEHAAVSLLLHSDHKPEPAVDEGKGGDGDGDGDDVSLQSVLASLVPALPASAPAPVSVPPKPPAPPARPLTLREQALTRDVGGGGGKFAEIRRQHMQTVQRQIARPLPTAAAKALARVDGAGGGGVTGRFSAGGGGKGVIERVRTSSVRSNVKRRVKAPV